MYAERIILETDHTGKIVNTPTLPANKQVEAIFLVLEDAKTKIKREPHPDLVGKFKIVGDIFESSPTSDWNL